MVIDRKHCMESTLRAAVEVSIVEGPGFFFGVELESDSVVELFDGPSKDISIDAGAPWYFERGLFVVKHGEGTATIIYQPKGYDPKPKELL